jgi:uncharacterized repeat protein (TIGR03803 family)
VIFDKVGNLYGTTIYGGGSSHIGTVFELSPSGSAWTEKVLYSFTGGSDGCEPYAGVIFDTSGNLYGATNDADCSGGGTVFKLTPSNGGGTYSLVHSFTGGCGPGCGCGPWGNLAIDGAGNLYGATLCDGPYNAGNVFELTPSGNSWIYTDLHDFTGGSDGGHAYTSVVIDGNGNLYGTTEEGGTKNDGAVWEITP